MRFREREKRGFGHWRNTEGVRVEEEARAKNEGKGEFCFG